MRHADRTDDLALCMDNLPLVLDLIEWLDGEPRTYDEVMGAWRSTCPRLTIWEDAVDARLVGVSGRWVSVTEAGSRLLRAHRSGKAAHS